MKKIFIYYSLTGNGDYIANYYRDNGNDVRKVITKEPLPEKFSLRMMSGGFKALINYKDKLDDFNNNIESYDEVVIGSPIWNSRLSSPINTVLKSVDLNNKKITFILYSGSGKENKATKKLKKMYPDSKIINLQEPKKNNDEINKI